VTDESEWTLIGKKSPQLPQMFYPVDNTDMTIKTGDIVAARCTMVNIVFPAAALSDDQKSPFSEISEVDLFLVTSCYDNKTNGCHGTQLIKSVKNYP
jgi:hypothetical protein